MSSQYWSWRQFQALLVMSESAQGRNGAFVELVSIFVGDRGSVTVEVVASTFIVIVFPSKGGGEIGLRETVELLAAFEALLEVITVRGRAVDAGVVVAAGRGTLPRVIGAGFTTLIGAAEPPWTMAAGMTGLNPEGAGWNTAAAGMVVGAREMMGVEGIGKATLNRGRGSPATPAVEAIGNPAGGERLSGEALGGVSGAYGMDIADTLGMLTTDMGVWMGCAAATFGTLTCELAAMAALMASSFWETRFSRWLTMRRRRGSLLSTPSTLDRKWAISAAHSLKPMTP